MTEAFTHWHRAALAVALLHTAEGALGQQPVNPPSRPALTATTFPSSSSPLKT